MTTFYHKSHGSRTPPQFGGWRNPRPFGRIRGGVKRTALSALLLASLILPGVADVTLRQARELAARTAPSVEAVGLPFELEGVITFPFDKGNDFFGFQDASGDVILRRSKEKVEPQVEAGDRVRIRGVTIPEEPHQTSALSQELQILSRGPAPQPVPLDVDRLQTGAYDNRFVRLQGIVRDVFIDEIDPQWIYLTVNARNRIVYVTHKTSGNNLLAPFEQTIGAEVAVDALCFAKAGGHRQFLGRYLKIHTKDAIHVLRSPSASPFDAPKLENFNELSPFDIIALGRRRVTGRVLAVWQGDHLLLKTHAGSVLRAVLGKREPPPCGATVDVVGLPETDFYRINLTRAVWRRSAEAVPSAEESPESVDVRRLMTDEHGRLRIDVDYHGRCIRLVGIVRNLPEGQGGDARLHVECGKYMIPIDVSACPNALRDLRVNSLIEATGVCVMETNDWHPLSHFPHVYGFSLVLRETDGLRVLKQPPWWTTNRLLTVIGTLLAGLLVTLVWNSSLRRFATRKGHELMREQLGHVKAELKTEERTRLAVELHDSLAQNLTGVSLEIDTAAKMADEDPSAMKAHLGIAARALKSCRDELRNCLWDLRNRALEEETMEAAIRQTLAPHLAGAELTIRFNVPRERISDNTAHALLRIIRELTLNALRHGHATKVAIAGSLDGGEMRVSVRDNGCGFDPAAAPGFAEGHYGLLGIQERIDEFEGEFILKSAPGKGAKATISIRVPQKRNEADECRTQG